MAFVVVKQVKLKNFVKKKKENGKVDWNMWNVIISKVEMQFCSRYGLVFIEK